MDLSTSLAMITLLGLTAHYIFTKLKLPGLLGMLLMGMLIGPHGLNWMSKDLMMVSGDFRLIALIVILLRAGLGVSREDLNKVGKTAFKLSFIPGLLEGFTIAILATTLLNFSFIQGGILGFIIAAVSPAVVVPSMLQYIEKGVGKKKGIPTLILAAASIDDVVAITIFSTFLGLYTGKEVNIGLKVAGIPISILLGVLLGIIIGSLFIYLFNKYHIRDSKKVLLLLGVAILLNSLSEFIKNSKSVVEVAGLLGVMTIGFILLEKKPIMAKRLAAKLNKVWLFAEILLFVLVGAQVNLDVALDAGLIGLVLLGAGLLARSIGVFISTIGSSYSLKEKMFCIIAYLPKATVQAAMGGIPFDQGVESGDKILALAVLSIIVTAPIGAIGIHLTAKKWLE